MTLCWEEKKKGVEYCLYVYFGPYGRREIEEALKTSNWWIKLFYSLFCTCFWIGLGYMWVLGRGPYSISLIGWDESKGVMFCFPFSFRPCYLVYIVYTFRCTSLGFLNTIAFTYKKKKNLISFYNILMRVDGKTKKRKMISF